MKPSTTAQLAAAHRAYHLMADHPPVFEDTAAAWLLGPPLNTILRAAPLRWLFWRPLIARVRPVTVRSSLCGVATPKIPLRRPAQ